jgi:predicted  nucleic acid-binding Zn-ribbon protein
MASAAEKERRLEDLQQQIAAAKGRVTELNQRINTEKLEISQAENELTLARHRKPLTVSERPVDPHTPVRYELNDEHEEILRKKRDCLPPLCREVEQLTEEQDQLQAQLNGLVEETDTFQSETTDLTESIRRSSGEGDRLQTELNYVEKQVAERKNEIRMLERLKNDADTAYAQLLDRAENADTLPGGRLDIEKAIDNLRTQISATRGHMEEREAMMSNSRADNDTDSAMMQARLGQFEEAVDWKVEREDLRAELDALTEEIRTRKAGVNAAEQRNTARQTSLAKYGPLVMKWRGKSNDPAPAKPMAQLWQELEETRRRSEEIVQAAEREMAEILQRNAKLEEDVTRRRQVLERTIAQFYGDENLSKKKIDEKRAKAEADEQKLLQQIQEAKLKLAQKYLRKQ